MLTWYLVGLNGECLWPPKPKVHSGVLFGYFSLLGDAPYLLIGVWLVEDRITNTVKTRVLRRLDCIFDFNRLFGRQQQDTSGRVLCVYPKGIDEGASLITMTKLGRV